MTWPRILLEWFLLLFNFRPYCVSWIRRWSSYILWIIMCWVWCLWLLEYSTILETLTTQTYFCTLAIFIIIKWWFYLILKWGGVAIFISKSCFISSSNRGSNAWTQPLRNVVEGVTSSLNKNYSGLDVDLNRVYFWKA